MMKTAAHVAAPISPESTRIRSDLRRSAKFWAAALMVSLAFGIVTGTFGLVINFLEFLGYLADQRRLSVIGVALLALTFPIAMLAAHCLDRAYQTRNAYRAECRRIDL